MVWRHGHRSSVLAMGGSSQAIDKEEDWWVRMTKRKRGAPKQQDNLREISIDDQTKGDRDEARTKKD